MILLAIEASSSERSVAVGRDGLVLASAVRVATRDTPLFRMIDDILARAAIPRSSVEGLVVGLGPGSYTGIRGAIAAAQGWALAQPETLRLYGIPSAEALAHRAWTDGLRGNHAVAIDAQRGEFYLATYRLEDVGPRLGAPLRLASRSELEAVVAAGYQPLGPDLHAILGGLPFTSKHPDAASLLALAGALPNPQAPETLEPVYLRATAFVKAPPPRAFPAA